MKTLAPSASTDEVISRFRARLVRRRDDAGLTRRALAIRLGIDHSTMTRLEQGARMPSLEMLVALADALGVDVTDLLSKQVEDADLAALERAHAGDLEQERARIARRSGAEMWPMKTSLNLGQGQRCLYPFEPCTCRAWVAPVDTHERMDA